jgi:DNA cross-link repair 1C protein
MIYKHILRAEATAATDANMPRITPWLSNTGYIVRCKPLPWGRHVSLVISASTCAIPPPTYHCPVIEDDRRAILYTGDVRSEPWFVNTLTRNPSLIAYTNGIYTLDKIYLDTSFTRRIPFQTKAEGLNELLHKVLQYPPQTIFHLSAWTFGYEDVWIALSKALKSRVCH